MNIDKQDRYTMPKYHPDTRFLTDYAAGSLPASQALCVASHLHYCSECRLKIQQLTSLGAELFMQQQPASSDNLGDNFSRLMARIDGLPAATTRQQRSSQVGETSAARASRLPSAIVKLTRGDLNSLKWYSMGKDFKYSHLNAGDRERETSLIHIRAGGSVPSHRHKGDEITVILKGSFSDQDDHYRIGDFVVRGAGEKHRPVASQDEDCLCIATLDAPISPTNWIYRLLMPFISPRPVHL